MESVGSEHVLNRRTAQTLLLVLVLAAFAVRLPRIDEAPRDFWTVRQYVLPLIARGFYVEGDASVPEWKRDVALSAARHTVRVEPRIMEWVAAHMFRAIGHEAFWPIRIQVVIAWIAGGVFLFLIVRELVSPAAGLVASAFYLFMPYGYTISRSLQYDPLMIAVLLAALWAMLRYDAEPSARCFWIAALLAGLALLLKPGKTQFTLSFVWLSLSLRRVGLRNTLTSWSTYGFHLILVLPLAAFLTYELAVQRNEFVSGQLSMCFKPDLLLTWYLWRGWAGILVTILSVSGLLLAAWGLVVLRRSRALVFAVAYLAAYVVQCLVTTAATATHDYWHVQIVPLAALGIGQVGHDLLSAGLRPPLLGARKAAAALLACAWVVLALARGPMQKTEAPRSRPYPEIAAEIGEAVGHTTKAVILDYDMGNSLRYFAMIDGDVWPVSAFMRVSRALGYHRLYDDTELPAAERYARLYAPKAPDYFIVARAIPELSLQPGLGEFLYSSFSVHTQGDHYVIFDLTRRRESQ